MKIKKIAAQCKATGRAWLYDYTDADGVVSQFISNGYAIYPVNGMPYLEEKHLATVLDLSAKDAEKMNLQAEDAPDEYEFRDTSEIFEIMARQRRLGICWCDMDLLALTAEEKTYFINADYLAPILAEHNVVQAWLRRTPKGKAYFAIKDGLMLVGIVMPEEGVEPLAAELADIAARVVGA